MPRKPKQEKHKFTVVVDGRTINVTLTPPTGPRKTWYAYWAGQKSGGKATKCTSLKEAIVAAEEMVRNDGKRPSVESNMTDEEFDEIQRQHYGKKKDPTAQKRALKSFGSCMDAITAFRLVTGIKPIVLATAADCERFQRLACELPKNWRDKYPNKQEDVEKLSPNTVIKYSVAMQAAWERANRNGGRKCVRGVVPDEKLLSSNPWQEFQWIEGREKEIRQFDGSELVSFLDYFNEKWPIVTIGALVAKTCLWSASRKSEVAELSWDCLRQVGEEYHFDTVGKWNVRKWFRIPKRLYEELEAVRTDSPYVFAAYNEQLRSHHEQSERPWLAHRVSAEFKPMNLGDWFYDRVKDWSETLPNGSACVHVFRKTTLKYARAGEDANRRVASDANLSENVMMDHYVTEDDPELREKSNRTFERIRRSLSDEVAIAYGDDRTPPDPLIEKLKAAEAKQDWATVAKIADQLQRRNGKAG